MLVGDVGDAVYRRELVSSQRLLKPLSTRGLGRQHGELHPTQSAARRRCYAQAPSHHLSPTSHQSPSRVLICLLNTSPCCPSPSPPTDPPTPTPVLGLSFSMGLCCSLCGRSPSYPWPPCGSQGGPLEASVLAFDSLVEVPLMSPGYSRTPLWFQSFEFKAPQSPNPHLSSLIRAPVYLKPSLQSL